MLRQIRNGVIGALATMGVIYLMGLIGIVLQGQPGIDMHILAPVGFIIAIAVGIFVLAKLSRRQP